MCTLRIWYEDGRARLVVVGEQVEFVDSTIVAVDKLDGDLNSDERRWVLNALSEFMCSKSEYRKVLHELYR